MAWKPSSWTPITQTQDNSHDNSGSINNVDPNSVGAFEKSAGQTGAFDVPVFGGVLRALTHPAFRAAETVAEGGRAAMDLPTILSQIIPTLQGKQHGGQALSNTPMFTSQNDYNQMTTPDLNDALNQSAKIGAGAASYFVPGAMGEAGLGAKGVSAMGAQGAVNGFAQSSNSPSDVAGNTAGGAILGMVPFGLGKALHPIQSLSEDVVNPALQNSDAMINMQKLINGFAHSALPEFDAKMQGTAARSAWNNSVEPDLEKAVASINPPYGNTGVPGNWNIPIAAAQDIKKGITSSPQDMYGPGVKNPDINVRKAIGSTLQQAIAKQAPPEVNAANWLMHNILYPLQDNGSAVVGSLPFGIGKTAQVAGGLPLKAAQKTFPSDPHAILKYLFPFLANVNGSSNSQQ